MRKLIGFFLLLLSSLACQAADRQNTSELHYSGYIFHIPANSSAIAAPGGDENMLIFRYGPDKGKNYLAFSDLNGDKNLALGCEPRLFFRSVFAGSPSNDCNQEQIDAFKTVFVDEHDIGSWSGSNLTIYYSIDERQSFLFAFDSKGKSLKIDTDFMDINELKAVVDHAL